MFYRMTPFLLAGTAMLASQAALASPTDSFTATYKLTKSGIPMGTATFTLRHAKKQGCYIYSGHAKPNAIVHLIIGDITEKSRFCVVDGQVRPSRFEHHIDGKPDDSYTLTFNWSKMTALSVNEEGDKKTYPIKPGTQDPMSLQVAARLWLASTTAGGAKPGAHTFVLADDDKTEEYRVQPSNGGTLDVPAGQYDTVKLARAGKHHHAMTFWMARYADWVPVQVDRVKDGSTSYTLTLQSLKRSDQGAGN